MKQLISITLFLVLCSLSFGQNVMNVYKCDGSIIQLPVTCIDSITYSTYYLPTLTTVNITDIGSATATGGGDISSDGGIAVRSRGVCWSTSQNPEYNGSATSNGTGSGPFVSSITGLSANTTYYVRAYATNILGTAYGNELNFTTKTAYAIGDTGPAGGLVFYLDGNGGGLEAAPKSTEWPANQWGCSNSVIGSTNTGIGSGQANTTAIVNGCFTTGIAANLCNNLDVNGFNDWFLPSKDELGLMRTNLFANGLGNFDGYRYWSSSEESAVLAWWESMDLGNKAAGSKINTYFVRAVRAF
jgi:hypothetical protein